MHEFLTWGFGSFLFPVLSYFLFSIVPVIFILIKWRMDHDKEHKDPQVGLKVLLYYFKTIALQVMLVSAAATAIAISKNTLSESFSFQLSLFIVGVVIYALHLVLIIMLTNRSAFPSVARYFTAYNIFIAGVVTMASAIMSIIFLAEGNNDSFNIVAPVALVYTVTWAVQLLILFKLPLFAGLMKRQ